MGLFSIKKEKPKEEPRKDTYYIEPTQSEEPKEQSWIEEQQNS